MSEQPGKDKMMTGLLLFSSLLALGIFAYAAYQENFAADWYKYQSRYKDQLISRATNDRERLAAKRFQVGQKQTYLPELVRIDRCVTCHVSIDDPNMKDAEQPLTAHPGDIMKNHPKERFGCTICHRGQGRATFAADAHGHVPHWPEPMLGKDDIDQSCPKCHMERELPGAPRYTRTMNLFYEKACISCHKLRGQGGTKGPDLSKAGELHDAEWHFKHFKNPRSVVATSEMPNLKLSDEEARTLVFLMMSLTGGSIPTEFLSNPKPRVAQSQPAKAIDPLASVGYVGSRVCLGCHQSLHPDAIDGWHKSKMTSTFERVKDEPAVGNCLPCHTTGLNPKTRHYSEKSVGCEACHGPGKDAVDLVLSGKVDEHKKLVRLNPNSTLVCVRCHNPHIPVGTHAEYYRRQKTTPSLTQATGQ